MMASGFLRPRGAHTQNGAVPYSHCPQLEYSHLPLPASWVDSIGSGHFLLLKQVLFQLMLLITSHGFRVVLLTHFRPLPCPEELELSGHGLLSFLLLFPLPLFLWPAVPLSGSAVPESAGQGGGERVRCVGKCLPASSLVLHG